MSFQPLHIPRHLRKKTRISFNTEPMPQDPDEMETGHVYYDAAADTLRFCFAPKGAHTFIMLGDYDATIHEPKSLESTADVTFTVDQVRALLKYAEVQA